LAHASSDMSTPVDSNTPRIAYTERWQEAQLHKQRGSEEWRECEMMVDRICDKSRRGGRRRSAQGSCHGARPSGPVHAGPKPKNARAPWPRRDARRLDSSRARLENMAARLAKRSKLTRSLMSASSFGKISVANAERRMHERGQGTHGMSGVLLFRSGISRQ
jgi:hypothetical protein